MKLYYQQIILIILLIWSCRLYSQNGILSEKDEFFKVTLYYRNGCDSLIHILNHYKLTQSDKSFISDSGICLIPDMGKYTLTSYDFESLENHIIFINRANQIDTINFSRIHVNRVSGIPPWPYISNCGERANGICSDYWPNGEPRIIGKFKRGEAKKITFYNSSGQILKRQINKKFNILFELYEDNKLILKYRKFLFLSFGKVWDEKQEKYVKRMSK